MSLCSLAGLRILSYIPRRGKGHTEVLMSIEVAGSKEELQPEDFIKYFSEYDKKALTKDTIFEIADIIKQGLNLPTLSVAFSFSLLVSKISPSYTNAPGFSIDCQYQVIIDGASRQFIMKLVVPARIQRVSVLKGALVLGLINPSPHIYFEDMLDIVQKFGEIIIYPPCSGEDVLLLHEAVKGGKEVDFYIKHISDGCKKRELSEKGYINIQVEDLYNMYTLTKEEKW